MRKIASIFGIGMVSMALGLAPAFAQQAMPKPAGNTPATVQPKTDVTTPASSAARDADTKSADVKNGAGAVQAKPGMDMKASPNPVKPGPEVKGAPVEGKSEAGLKSEKAAPAKQGANLKAGKHHKQAKNATKSNARHEHHAKAKAQVRDTDKKMETNGPATPSAR